VRFGFLSLALVVALVGCGGSAFVDTHASPEARQAATSIVSYRAFGDSITFGLTLADPGTQSYPPLVAAQMNVADFANYGIPTEEACDIANMEIAAHQVSPTLTMRPFYSVLVGANDLRQDNVVEHEATYTACLQAILSWLAVPREYKVLAGDSGMKRTGAGDIQVADGWKIWLTHSQGASVSFTITTTKPGPIYAWPRLNDAVRAEYTYLLDGVRVGGFSSSDLPPVATKKGTTRSLGFLRIKDVPAGTHTITFVQMSADGKGAGIVGVGAPRGEIKGVLPTVLAGTLTLEYYKTTPGICAPSEPLCLSYIQKIRNSVSLFRDDGLNVKLFDTRKYMLGTAAEMSDRVHPNAFGQEELSHSVEAVW
jgi:hypothetical protein